ncbi:hypothetical protein V2G26_003025 [Clonostachys chloroleuca]
MGAAEAWETRPLSHLKDKLALEKPGFLVLAALWVGGLSKTCQAVFVLLSVEQPRGEYVNRYTRRAFMYIGSGGWMLEGEWMAGEGGRRKEETYASIAGEQLSCTSGKSYSLQQCIGACLLHSHGR